MTDQKQQQVSEILTVIVKYNRLAEYERWLQKTEVALAQQNGFLGIEVIRPSDITAPEYFILLRFETLIDLETWKNSKVLKENELPRGRAHEVSIRLFSSKTFYHI